MGVKKRATLEDQFRVPCIDCIYGVRTNSFLYRPETDSYLLLALCDNPDSDRHDKSQEYCGSCGKGCFREELFSH